MVRYMDNTPADGKDWRAPSGMVLLGRIELASQPLSALKIQGIFLAAVTDVMPECNRIFKRRVTGSLRSGETGTWNGAPDNRGPRLVYFRSGCLIRSRSVVLGCV